jgi:hypothetical protein
MRILELVIASISVSVAIIPLITAALWIVDPNHLAYMLDLTVLLGLAAAVLLMRKVLSNQKDRSELFHLTRKECLLLLILLIQATLLSLYTYKYPLFHDTSSPDASRHVGSIAQILRDGGDSLLGAAYPYAFHFLVSNLVSSGDEGLLTGVKVMVAVIELLNISLVFLAGRRVLGEDEGLLAAVAYGLLFLPGLWFIIDLGSYTSLLGFHNTLAFLYMLFLHRSGEDKVVSTLSMAAMGLAALFTHSMAFFIYPLLWSFIPVIYFLKGNSVKRYVQLTVSATIAPLLILLVAPNIIYRLQAAASGGLVLTFSGDFILNIIRSSSQPWLNTLGYVYFFGGRFNFILIPIASYLILKRRDPWRFLFLIWVILPLAPAQLMGQNEARYALYMLLPVAFLVGTLLSEAYRRTKDKALILTIIVVLLVLGPFARWVSVAASDIEGTRARQIDIYGSMKWIEVKTPSNATFIGVQLDEYRYLPTVSNRDIVRIYGTSNSTTLTEISKQTTAQYVVMPVSLDFSSGEQTGLLAEVYRNTHVKIYEIRK